MALVYRHLEAEHTLAHAAREELQRATWVTMGSFLEVTGTTHVAAVNVAATDLSMRSKMMS